jgi:hypothetical protein
MIKVNIKRYIWDGGSMLSNESELLFMPSAYKAGSNNKWQRSPRGR